MVSMRDGVKLSTDIYRPNDSDQHPVILYRTPYNKDGDNLGASAIQLVNFRGFVYVAQDCRGRFASQGNDSVFVTDGWGALQDGYDTIEWITQQNWCDGKVGMFGGSATGITSYRAAGAAHPNLEAVVAVVAPSDFYHEVVFPGGEFRKAIVENWIHGQGSDYMIDYFLQYPYYNSLWEEMNLHTPLNNITAAIYHIGGWYDCFSEGPVAAFNALRLLPQAGPQKLIMGPWTHGTTGSDEIVGELDYPDASVDGQTIILSWLDHWVAGNENGIMDAAEVQYYLMGDPDKTSEAGCQWIETDKWPPENTKALALFLNNDGLLNSNLPESDGELSFNYDPNNPLPTHGGNNLTIDAGPYDQGYLGEREDILEFESEVLEQPVRIEGIIKGQLYVSSNCPDTDFTLKLVDVYPDGREMLVTDGIARTRFRLGETESDMSFLTPGEIVQLTVELPPTAIVFNSGHRMKVCISSSNYPRYEINPNTANELYDLSEKQIAINTVYFGSNYPSSIIFPTVEIPSLVETSIMEDLSFKLFANYPNPFNSRTNINYQLNRFGEVKLSILNIQGQIVKTLVDERKDQGIYTQSWDGRNDADLPVAGGVYIFQLQFGGSVAAKKLLFLK